VQSGAAHYGVVPFENSTNGSVVTTLDLLADPQRKFPDILVCSEAYVEVRHCLLGHSASPSSTSNRHAVNEQTYPYPNHQPFNFSRITKLYSHPQAWTQCSSFLTIQLPSIERQDVSSTSKAAALVAADPSGTTAAISSPMAAELFALDVLASGIQDRHDNLTRFLVLHHRGQSESRGCGDSIPSLHPLVTAPATPQTPTPSQTADKQGPRPSGNNNSKAHKTLVAFTVAHDNPGALAKSLAVFEPYRLNLTSINARPSGGPAWNYVFLVEVAHQGEGQGRSVQDGEGAVEMALGDLGRVARSWRWRGSWESKLGKS